MPYLRTKMSTVKKRGLATSSDPDEVPLKKWALRVGETVVSEKVSVSRRRNHKFLSLPFLTAGARVLKTNISMCRACAHK